MKHHLIQSPCMTTTCSKFSLFLSPPCSLVFRMVEAEEEYVDQLETLISCFLRPFKMAASSKSPPCNHEDINSIFLGHNPPPPAKAYICTSSPFVIF